MRIAVISDIHGNKWALEAVLNDIQSKNIDTIINLGDTFYGPLDPKGTFELIKNTKMISIQGNTDRVILETLENGTDNSTFQYVVNQINNDAIQWLKALDPEIIIDDKIYLCHGVPKVDTVCLVEKFTTKGVEIREESEIEELLEGIQQPIVLCGHSHLPRVVKTSEKLIINPGSIGLQAFDDESPVYHKMENLHPNARYCILDIGNQCKTEHISVPYNYKAAVEKAKENNRQDWAKWIDSGRV